MPDFAQLTPFALFGMGRRPKLLYRRGQLFDALDGALLAEWPVARERYDLTEYRLTLELADGGEVVIEEDEQHVWLREGTSQRSLGEGRVNLPRFDPHPQAALLRRLHHELLVNIVDGGPLPNLLVYKKPWYRDAAMVAMCLKQTGNLHLICDWIQSLRDPFDRNNANNEEPDNLGQLLYLISLLPDSPLPAAVCSGMGEGLGVRAVLAAAERFRRDDHLVGITDGSEHPVYQTKWLKFGLRALGLPDPWRIPEVPDSYSALFWMDYRDQHVALPPNASGNAEYYPYLAWAEAHFYDGEPPTVPGSAGIPAGSRWSPLTWEAHASEADYTGMAMVGEEYEQGRLCTPHTWHAAEMFLYWLSR